METTAHVSGFRREVLEEFQYAESQILAIAYSVPAEDYGWAPAEEARTFAAVLVHIAVSNLGLLDRAGAKAPEAVDLYAGIEGAADRRVAAIVHRNLALEASLTEKAAIIDLVARSFAAVKLSWTEATEGELWATVHLFHELETARRLYLRMLAHSYEHLGQEIAYVRAMGYRVPWPDSVKKLDELDGNLTAQ